MKALRSRFISIVIEDAKIFDPALILAGNPRIDVRPSVILFSALSRSSIALSVRMVEEIMRFQEDRITTIDFESGDGSGELVKSDIDLLLKIGALISPDISDNDYFSVEMRMRKIGWQKESAVYHAFSLWQGIDKVTKLPRDVSELFRTKEGVDSALEERIREVGMPPRHFAQVPNIVDSLTLPVPKESLLRKLDFLSVLKARATTRVFDQGHAVPLDKVSAQLYFTFGALGLHKVYEDVYGLKRTSPSGGCLHPTECYMLANSVEGVEPGLYHYNSESHRLDKISAMTEVESRELSHVVSAGQVYPSTAGYLTLLTSRFRRNFWKYENHKKAYCVLYQDIAHLSQTSYMVCAALGLGAFYTAAINNVEANAALGLDGVDESCLALCGVGIPSVEQFNLKPAFEEYRPWLDGKGE